MSNGIPNSSNPPSAFGANPFRTRPDQPGFGMNSGKKVPSLLSVVFCSTVSNCLVLAGPLYNVVLFSLINLSVFPLIH